MIVLHPYAKDAPERKRETWEFLSTIRDKYTVIDGLVDRGMGYHDFLRKHWGADDLIILEDDKVPTPFDFDELVACGWRACCFPHAVSFYAETHMSLWTEQFPYSLGFVKFTKVAQLDTPASLWYGHSPIAYLDRLIEQPMIARYGAMHLHKRFVKHNHGTGIVRY